MKYVGAVLGAICLVMLFGLAACAPTSQDEVVGGNTDTAWNAWKAGYIDVPGKDFEVFCLYRSMGEQSAILSCDWEDTRPSE